MERIENKEAQEIFIEAGRLQEFYYYFYVLPEDIPETYSWWLDRKTGYLELKLWGSDDALSKVTGYHGLLGLGGIKVRWKQWLEGVL